MAPYVTLMTEDAPQRDHSLRAVCNGLRWMVRAGAAWRLRPPALPPWHTVSQPSQRGLTVGVVETMVQDLRAVRRLAAGPPRGPLGRPCREPHAASVRAMTGPHAAAARKSTWPWLSWGLWGRRTARRPPRQTGARAGSWQTGAKR